MKIDKEKSVLLVIDMQPRFLQLVPGHEQILGNCSWLVSLAQDTDVPVLLSAHYPRGMGPVSETLTRNLPQGRCVEKSYFSCVEDGCLHGVAEAEREHWILCGIESHACVMLTALDLAAAGNKVFLVVDATASRSSPDKEIALQRMVAAGITLVTREMVFFELLRTAGTPPIQGLQQKISALMNKNLSRSAGLAPIAFSAGLTYSKKRPIFASTAQCGNGLGLWSRPANI